MTTLSVPISPEHEEFIQKYIKEGKADNKAQVVRRALTRLSEEEAVEAVFRAMSEPSLKGDLRELSKKMR